MKLELMISGTEWCGTKHLSVKDVVGMHLYETAKLGRTLFVDGTLYEAIDPALTFYMEDERLVAHLSLGLKAVLV